MFDQQDIDQISKKGMTIPFIRKQIDHFISGFPYIQLARPAIAGDGIIRFGEDQVEFYRDYFEHQAPGLKIVKFVPASGAASRMFRHLFEFRDQHQPNEAGNELLMKDLGFNSVHYFITHLNQFAFFSDLCAVLARSGTSPEQLIEDRDYTALIDGILSADGMNYANLPKALLKFHSYPEGPRTAAEEHMAEAAVYAKDHDKTARLHFTISPEHQERFMALLAGVRRNYELQLDVKFDVSTSFQKASTDTIAVDVANQPVRNPDGSLLFRPGGHGALLENLNEIDADLIFIKNIDNVVPDHIKGMTFRYKKLLGGYLLFLQDRISGFLARLKDPGAAPDIIGEVAEFAQEKLFLDLPDHFGRFPVVDQANMLIDLLNRPVRVCGMVKNEGEPGGGPFWVKGDDKRLSLQVVESSQIDMKDKAQKDIVDRSTHFNPVDLVCSTRNFEGVKFDLKNFVDENTGFISLKSSGGKTLKAQELPGLWNGAMAKWITIFVEVPVITFNPVKTVNDLLRAEHLPL